MRTSKFYGNFTTRRSCGSPMVSRSRVLSCCCRKLRQTDLQDLEPASVTVGPPSSHPSGSADCVVTYYAPSPTRGPSSAACILSSSGTLPTDRPTRHAMPSHVCHACQHHTPPTANMTDCSSSSSSSRVGRCSTAWSEVRCCRTCSFHWFGTRRRRCYVF
jgi:hypothetical protein